MAAMVNMTSLLNGKDSRWLQLEVCREFQRNKCSRQDTECKFAHPPANVEVQNGKVTACYDSIKGRCNRDKPPCKYFHPPQHLKDQLLINGRNHLALKNALMQQMGIAPGQPVIPGQVPQVATNPYLTGIPANTYSPYFAPGHLVPALLGPDPTAVSQLGPVVPQAVQVAQQKIPRSDRLEAYSGMVPIKRPAAEKSGIPVYPGATTYQQLMQLQQPFVPVSYDKVEVCDQRVAVCRDHANGQCRRKQCKYYHIPIVLPPANIMAALINGNNSNNNNNNISSNNNTNTHNQQQQQQNTLQQQQQQQQHDYEQQLKLTTTCGVVIPSTTATIATTNYNNNLIIIEPHHQQHFYTPATISYTTTQHQQQQSCLPTAKALTTQTNLFHHQQQPQQHASTALSHIYHTSQQQPQQYQQLQYTTANTNYNSHHHHHQQQHPQIHYQQQYQHHQQQHHSHHHHHPHQHHHITSPYSPSAASTSSSASSSLSCSKACSPTLSTTTTHSTTSTATIPTPMAANYLPLAAAAPLQPPATATNTTTPNYLKAPPHPAPNAAATAMTIAIATQAPPLVLGTTLSNSNYNTNCIPILTQPTDVTTLTGAAAALTQHPGHPTHAFIYPATAQPQH
ncbi:muscleblind-like protein 1 isoform X7 [Lucilia cuprina]|uniref:muscleblind-like protein 1 isoform X7 n=1 Tax=Lucilia cuprina TaxID=7375 RepID=UPI001F063F5E|nr:muscleblind-like protein 1 isoform X7 [Lucilia cuprina]